MENLLISVVVPVYHGERLTQELVDRLLKALSQLNSSFEIILIDDRSPDKSWEVINKICLADFRIKGIRLSRNFGQHYAISAGLENSKGEWVVVMDCDLQDRPEEIPSLFHKAQEGFQVVLARRFERKDNVLKKWFSRTFYKVLSYLTGSPIDPAVANFGIYHRKVVNSICSMRESIRFFPTMVKWVGFSTTHIDVEHAERAEGKTTYNLKKRLRLALEIILAYSDKPLRLAVKLGFLIAFLSFFAGIFALYKYLTGQIIVLGYASLIVSIWFLSGLMILIIGIAGLYIGKIFEGVKQRPIFIADEKINL